MADDSERDVVPVKDGSSYERQRNVSTLSLSGDRDILPAPYISKLDRKELEDRYMNLMLDKSHLKKECNKQEEKIKRLATKLLRLVAEQKRDIPTAAQRHDHNLECMVVEQQQQIHELQQSNTQLQDRLVVLRNQLVEHTSLHSAVHCNFMRKSRLPAHSNTRTCTTSRIPAVVPSHDSQNMFQQNSQTNTVHPRTATSPSQPLGTEVIADHERFIDEQRSAEVPNSNTTTMQQNQDLPKEIMRLHEQISILEQDLETHREQSSARIGELEDELANTVAQDQRQKVAENVEIIRLQRSLQQQSAHLAAQSAKNQVLEQEVAHLRQELEAVQQDNDELQHQLMNEHQKVADLQQELQGVGSNRQSVRELQEQIRDIQNERSTLKEHNERLLALMSSRQIQSSEQEVALRSQVSQLESMLAKEQSERAQLMQRIEQLQLEVARLEAALATELKERSSLLETVNEMHQKMSEPKSLPSSDKESAVRIQVTQLETTLAKELTDRTHILQSLEEERTQMAALKVAHSDLLVRFQDLQARLNETESQLQTLHQEKSNSIPEEGSQTSDVSARLKIPDHSSWQNDEVNVMAALPENRTAAADQLDICRELEKCRELLRVQYNLNSVYKKEVESLVQQLNRSKDDKAKEMDEMSKLLQMHTAHINKLQNHLGTSKLDCTAHDTRHLTIGMGEGLFEIHVDHLQLSPEALGSLVAQPCVGVYQEKESPSLFLTWIFYNQDVAYTPVKTAGTNVEFDSSSVHRVTVNYEFLEYLKKEHCIIDVHMAVDDASETVATGTIQFSELLKFPQNKIHSTVPLVGTESCEAIIGFGILQCWFQLSCSVSLISSCIQHRTVDKVTRTKMPIPAPRRKGKQTSEISHLVSNKSPDNIITEKQVHPEEDPTPDDAEEKMPVKCSTKEEASTEYKVKEKCPVEGNSGETSAEYIPEESVQVNKGTSDRKPSDSCIETGYSKQVHVGVSIDSLFLNDKSSVMKDPEVSQLYVEYQFLGFQGQELETPTSLKKPQSAPCHLVYNFEKLFYVDKEEHAVQRNKLRAMLKPGPEHNNIMSFVIVSEPLEEESFIKDCKEVGYAELNLLQALACCDENICKKNLPVHSATNEEIGFLSVTLKGIHLMKKIAFESE